VPEDGNRATSPAISQADSLYQGFPDFSAWAKLSPADVDLWDRFAASLDERRKTATPEALQAAVEVAIRAAALDTGAIEGLYTVDRGFTMTVALQSLAWEQAIAERGAGVRELFEAQLGAYEVVLDAVTHHRPITEVWIRTLHQVLCAPQKTYQVLTDVGWQEQELPKGQYKTRPNHVLLKDGSFHAYAPVDLVSSEMHRLLEQIRTPELEVAHPVLQASYVHYAFVMIHPFADGNGRVARALASTYFYRAESIPLVIFANQRPAYLDALAAADRGDFRPVISFFGDRGIDTMQLVAESLMTATRPKLDDLAARISRSLPESEVLSSAEAENISRRLYAEIRLQFQSQVEELSSPNLPLEILSSMVPISAVSLARFGGADLGSLHLRLEAGPSQSAIATTITVSVFFSAGSSFPFVIRLAENPDRLEIRLEDVFPELTPNLKLRLSQWVQRRLGEMLRELERQTGAAPP
jgi:Fic family protein